jgi:chromodomain-helicase-DNA-binding protein 5
MEDMTAFAEIHPDQPNRILLKAPFVMNEHIKEIPGRKWSNANSEWTIPLSWTACLAMRDEFPDLNVGPNLREWALRHGANKRWLRDNRLNVDLNPDEVHLNKLVMSDEFQWLYPHQRCDALSIYIAGGSFLLMNDVGTGKTAASLSGLRLLDIASESGTTSPFPVLIVAPKSMLITWEREIRKAFPDAWGPDQRTISIVDGTPTKVRKALEPGFDFYIIGWELLRRYSRVAPYGSETMPAGANVDKELNALGISTIIGDEIHRVSNPTSQRSRAFKYLTHRVNYRLGLTGTPIQEGGVDLWHILHCIIPHEYTTKGAYISRYLLEEFGEWGERIISGIKPTRDKEFRNNFNAVTRRMTKDILPNLPPVIESIRWVTLPPAHRKAYNSMKNNLIAEIDGGTLTAQNQLVKAGRLVQLANSFGELNVEQNEDGTTTETFTMTDKSPKLDAFMEDIINGDYEGHQVVVFSASKQLLTFLEARLEKAGQTYTKITGDVTGEDRQKAMDTFQAGGVQFCLLTEAGGEGITLTAADTMVRLIRSWSYRVDVQVAARILRIGSEIHESINYIDYLVENTIDEDKVVRLNVKGEAAEEVLRDGELRAMLADDDPDDEA